jgi:hypothetical protein
MRAWRFSVSVASGLIFFGLVCARVHAQAALLMEEPYGFFGTLNPTGHNAIYFERICAETPVKLRHCDANEAGVVIARYSGISGYDWVAIPLVPYLYSVEDIGNVPAHVDRDSVALMRDRYHETHLLSLGEGVKAGDFWHGGWSQLLGVAYERRIYAFRFATTEAQDDALIEKLNDGENRSHFDLLYNNCADFARGVLNTYFPHTFKRSLFPDAGVTTPKQIAYKLVRYAKKHPELELAVFDIDQVRGYRRPSHSNKSIAESLTTTLYAVPIMLVNPYLAGGLFVDYLVRGHYKIIPKGVATLEPASLFSLTSPSDTEENALNLSSQASSATTVPTREIRFQDVAFKSQKE